MNLGQFHGWGRSDADNKRGVHGLPVAEGTLTSHTPVAKDEVTRIPKTVRTYLLASVKAYTLE
jgi:hypothetical protein